MELKNYLRAIWRAIPWLVLGTAIATAASVLVTIYFIEPTYRASTTLMVNYTETGANASSYSAALTSERLARTYATLVTKDTVLRQAAEKVGVELAPQVLAQHVRVTAPADTAVIDLAVDDHDAVRSAELANAIAEAFSEYIAGIQAEMGISDAAQEQDQAYRLSAQRSNLVATMNAYVQSYGDLMALYLAFGNEIQSYRQPEIVYSRTEIDEIGLDLRRQMSDTLAAISDLEERIKDTEVEQPVIGMTRADWYDELERLEAQLLQYRSLYADLLSTQAALKNTQLQEQRPAPGEPAPPPGPPVFTAELEALAEDVEIVKAKISETQTEIEQHRASRPVDFIVTPREVDEKLAALRAELSEKRGTYANLAGSYLQHWQFLQANVRPARPEAYIQELQGRQEQVAAEAANIWSEIQRLRNELKTVEVEVSAAAGPPLIVIIEAETPLIPVGPDPMLNGLIAGVAAFMFIILVVLLIEYLRATEDRPIGAVA